MGGVVSPWKRLVSVAFEPVHTMDDTQDIMVLLAVMLQST